MLSQEELEAVAAQMENSRVERKASLTSKSKSKIEEAICAFSNDIDGSGEIGVVLIGVDDTTGKPTGLRVTDQMLLNLTGIRGDGRILPFPLLVAYEATLHGESIAVVEVKPSPSPPVRLNGRVVIRPGPPIATASRDEERVLVERRQSLELSFDQRSVFGASLEDLDIRLFEQELLPSAVDPGVLAENRRSRVEQLAALHLSNAEGTPNVAGLLVLGRDPTGFIPGAYVQFLRIDGTELTDEIIDRKELVGPLPEILRLLDEIAKAHIRVANRLDDGPLETRSPDFPLAALQQLLRNAVMHRNYDSSNAPTQWYWFSDRIEIHNPGGLYGRASAETFGLPGGNDYRNPVVAAALHQLGFVQRFGMGVPLARKACAENGNPVPEFVFQSSSFAVIIKRRP